MIYKAQVRRGATYTRNSMRLIEEAMRWGDWQRVAELSNELSAVWGTIGQDAEHRAHGTEGDMQ